MDFNARVGNQPTEEISGPYGKTKLNKNGKILKVFIVSNELWVTEIFFYHKEVHMAIRTL